MSKSKENETEEFRRLYELLNNLAMNNTDPERVISIDTDELIRSKKPLNEIITVEAPKRTIVIDDAIHTPQKEEQGQEQVKHTKSIYESMKKIFPSFSEQESTSFESIKPLHSIDQIEQKESITIEQTKESNSPNTMSINIGIQLQASHPQLSYSIERKDNPMIININNQRDESTMTLRIGMQLSDSIVSDSVSTNSKTLSENEMDMETENETESFDEHQIIPPMESIDPDNPSTPLVFNYPTCKACNKTFTHFKFLRSHLKRYPVCHEWITKFQKDHKAIPRKGIHMLVEEYLHQIITGDKPHQCKYCKNVFTNTSNHHKHYHAFVSCNRMALLDFIKNVESLLH